MSSGARSGKHLNRWSLWRYAGMWWGSANNRPAAACITGTEETSGAFKWARLSFSGLGRRKTLGFPGKSTEFGYTLTHIFKHNLKSMFIQQSCSACSWIWATIWCTYLIELGTLAWNRGLWQHPSAIWGKKRWATSQINWHPKIITWTLMLNSLKLWSWRLQTWLRHD